MFDRNDLVLLACDNEHRCSDLTVVGYLSPSNDPAK